MAEVEKRGRTMFPDLFDWLEDFPRPTFRPFSEIQPIRVEDYEESGRYVMRAELPGIDPDKDVEITVDDNTLTVRAERRQEIKDKHRSEFRYGAFSRTVRLPKAANADDVKASYTNGVLTITIGMKEQKEETKRIAITKE
jgi:HSP20 family molecular chaperone IbpA